MIQAYPAKILQVVAVVLIIASGAYSEKVKTFDPAGSTSTIVQAMNSSGQITGYFTDAAGLHGFLRQSGGSITSFDIPDNGPLVFTVPTAINSSGNVVGWYPTGDFAIHSFLRDADGTITKFAEASQQSAQRVTANALPPQTPAPPRGSIIGVGDWPNAVGWNGTIIGALGDFSYDAYIRQSNGDVTTFSVPPQTSVIPDTQPQTINLFGQIAGYYVEEDGEHGFLRQPSGTIVRFTVGNARTIPMSMNFISQLTGYYTDDAGDHGFVRDFFGNIAKFDPRDSTSTRAMAINSWGEVTGFYLDAAGTYHGFIRKANGKIKRFSVPAAGSGNSQGTFPQAINDEGQVAGYYQDAGSAFHGFILKP